jgi:hypothetical protein
MTRISRMMEFKYPCHPRDPRSNPSMLHEEITKDILGSAMAVLLTFVN